MKELVLFVATFLIIFLIYYLFVIRRKKYLEKFMNGKEVGYLKKVYKIKLKKEDYKKLALLIALTNSFIISVAVSIVCFFNNILLQLLLGFVVVIGLILLCYHIIGKIMKKK